MPRSFFRSCCADGDAEHGPPREKYFPDAKFSEGNRPLFAFASYNCGPGNVAKMRKEAAKRGLDPDKWFNDVEIVTAEKIGIESTTYVRNICAEKAREQVAPPKG